MTINEAIALKLELQNVQRVLQGIRDVRQQVERFGQTARSSSAATVTANERAAASFGNLASKVATATAAIYTLKKGYDGVITSIEAFQSKRGATKALELSYGAAGAKTVMRQVDELSMRQGTELDAGRRTAVSLAATGQLGVNQVTPTIRAFLALAGQTNASTEQIKRALEQYGQIASQGRLQGDELRSIQENMVQLRKLLQDAGLGSRIYNQQNPLTFKEINDVLLKFGETANAAKALKNQSDQATNAIQRLRNLIILKFIAPLGEKLAPTIKVVAELLGDAVDWISRLPHWLKEVGFWFLGATGLIVAIKAAVGIFGVVSGVVTGRFTTAIYTASAALDRLAASAGLASGGKGGAGAGGLRGNQPSAVVGPNARNQPSKFPAEVGLDANIRPKLGGSQNAKLGPGGQWSPVQNDLRAIPSKIAEDINAKMDSAYGKAGVLAALIAGATWAGKTGTEYFKELRRYEDERAKAIGSTSWQDAYAELVQRARLYRSWDKPDWAGEEMGKARRLRSRNSDRPASRGDVNRLISGLIGGGLEGAF